MKKMQIKKYNIKNYAYFVLMLAVVIIMILPLIWLFSASGQSLSDISRTPFRWLPQEFSLKNFMDAWNIGKLGYAFFSSLCNASLYIVFHLFFCTVSGYIFAKYSFRFKNVIFLFILITMMVPPEITYLPVYDIIKKIGLINTYPGVVLPCLISGFGIFFMRQFATYIPNELIESARIDGCGNLRTFFQIAVPLLKSAIAGLAILAFTYIWNDYVWPSLVINTDTMRTLPVVLATLANPQNKDILYNEVIAGGVIALLPVLLIFVIFQKQFVETVANSGIKG